MDRRDVAVITIDRTTGEELDRIEAGPDVDYVLTLSPGMVLDGEVRHSNGTVVLTLKSCEREV